MTFVPGVAAVLALLTIATLIKQDIGESGVY